MQIFSQNKVTFYNFYKHFRFIQKLDALTPLLLYKLYICFLMMYKACLCNDKATIYKQWFHQLERKIFGFIPICTLKSWCAFIYYPPYISAFPNHIKYYSTYCGAKFLVLSDNCVFAIQLRKKWMLFRYYVQILMANLYGFG